MPSDTNSALLGLLMQATGNNNNTWGDNLNNFVFEYLEQAIAGYVTKSVTGGAATLTAAQHRAGMIEFSGTLTSNCTVTVDNISKRWRIFNNTDGAYVLLMKTASGTAIEIPQGTHKDVVCDGNDVLYREDEDEVGNFVLHGGTTAPPGTLACSGGTFVRADHPNLYDKIGTTWGAGNGVTTAGLPNLTDTNRFLRAADGTTIAVGTYQSNQNKAHTHAGASFSGTTGNISADHSHTYSGSTGSESADHVHSYTSPGGTNSSTGGGSFTIYNTGSPSFITSSSGRSAGHTHSFSGTTSGVSSNHTHTFSGTTGTIPSDGGTEARPESAAVLVCIKI
ncbi:phage tail protein [Bradyrhizobium japonicum]|uniref:phage tail protein n=1 Tax=Bradyrhizobium japonicum TaxID=375 RepID=UPI00040275F2|nr:tail fiber protein [Bradyrhizobium japonicum]